MTSVLVDSVPEALAAMHLALARGRPFDIVLTDVRMPDADGFALAEAIRNEPAIAGAAVMMLTSAGQPGDAARCRDLGVAAYLTKPIRRSELSAAMLLAVGARPTDGRPPLVTRHSLRERRPPARILLVEDNEINQLVARNLLERRGHAVAVAANGREALAALDAAAAPFDCVLMDVQMPEMDGFECTAIIRRREHGTAAHLPIVAMTAHAMKGDEARCLAAGMDDYVSKPIQPEALFETVDRVLDTAGKRRLQLGPSS
jgi:CheY-like chemotaxis protein